MARLRRVWYKVRADMEMEFWHVLYCRQRHPCSLRCCREEVSGFSRGHFKTGRDSGGARFVDVAYFEQFRDGLVREADLHRGVDGCTAQVFVGEDFVVVPRFGRACCHDDSEGFLFWRVAPICGWHLVP